MKNAILIILLGVFFTASSIAQSDTISFETLMKNKVETLLYTTGEDTLTGSLVHIDSTSITVQFQDGSQETYFEGEIKVIQFFLGHPRIKLDPVSEQYIERIFLSSTAFNLPNGEAEYRNVMLFYNGFHKSLSENISFGGAVIPAVFINLAILDAKATIRLGNEVRAGVAMAFGGGFFGEGEFKSNSTFYSGAYGMLTLGSKRRFINLLGGRVSGDELGDDYNTEWIYSIGAKLTGNKVNFYTEFTRHPAYFMELANITGLTVKVKSLVYDFGLLISLEGNGLLPAVSLSKRF